MGGVSRLRKHLKAMSSEPRAPPSSSGDAPQTAPAVFWGAGVGQVALQAASHTYPVCGWPAAAGVCVPSFESSQCDASNPSELAGLPGGSPEQRLRLAAAGPALSPVFAVTAPHPPLPPRNAGGVCSCAGAACFPQRRGFVGSSCPGSALVCFWA
ncbi:MAG: hypothetical protein J3K34DRAFT_108837 [Monoraphidium minutum]|nr:MAG: hypothetical protein J3K34DRAFT_108837 [Monoraphidium minutum]